MKKFFCKASAMLMVATLAVVSVSCNSYEDEQPTTKESVAVKNSLRGVVLDQDGAVLTDASVTINGRSVAVTGNTFESLGLSDGTYTVVVKKAGYKDSEPKVVTLASSTQVVDGESVVVGQDATCVIYLFKEESATVKIGLAGDEETITIETSTQDDGTGAIVGNTQDPTDASLNTEITVTAETPAVTSTDLAGITSQLPAGFSLDNLSFKLTNMASLREARTKAIIIAGESLPGNYTFFTGCNLETNAPVPVDFSGIAGFAIDVTLSLPQDVKSAVKLYRNVGASTEWKELTSASTGEGIVSVDFSASNKIVVKLNILENQSFALGVQIDQSETTTTAEAITATPVVNNSASTINVPTMNYTAKSRGVVLKNLTQGSMVDYLRKVVLRYYSIRAIYEAKSETFAYPVAYKLVPNGTLYLAGFQNVETSVFKIANGTSSFQAQEYGDVMAYPYAIVPDVPVQHGGGSND